MLGAVLDEAWTLYTRFFTRFFVIGLAVFGVLSATYALLLEVIDEGSIGGSLAALLVFVVTSIVGSSWLQGTLVHAVVDARDGTLELSIGDAFRWARPFIGVIILASLLAALGIAGGFLLLIVPGVFLAVRWSVFAPAIVLEGLGPRAALGRSFALVRGSSWVVLAIVLVTAVLGAIASSLLEAAFSAFPRFVEILVGSTIASAAVQPFSAVALTLTFLRLREEKEPAAVQEAPTPLAP